MFECSLVQGVLFKKIVQALSDVVEQGNFMIDENAISFQGMDSSHVSLVSLVMQASGFSPYRCDRDITLGITFASMNKVLRCMGPKDKLSLCVNEDDDCANFVFEDEKKGQISNFSLKLMDINQDQLGIPETEYKAVINMPSQEFQRICRDLSAIGDTVQISCDKGSVSFGVNGDIGKGDITLANSNSKNIDSDDNDDSDSITITVDEPVVQQFSIKFLNNFTKGTGLSKKVSISLGPEVPLEVSYDIENLGHLRYYLAPKIDEMNE